MQQKQWCWVSEHLPRLRRDRQFPRVNLDKAKALATSKSQFSSPLTYTWPQLVSNVPIFAPYSPLWGFIAKTLFSGGRCFLPSCLGAGNYGCSGRVVRGDRRRLLRFERAPLDSTSSPGLYSNVNTPDTLTWADTAMWRGMASCNSLSLHVSQDTRKKSFSNWSISSQLLN